VFIKPPSVGELERRLRERQCDAEEAIQQRLETGKKEIEYAEQPGSHDKIIINDSVDRAYAELEAFVMEN
jgi:guanylate kinase